MENINSDFFNSLNNPGKEFSPIPLWFWNDDLDSAEIMRQIDDFESHGVYGFMVHPRMGIPKDIPYMSDRYLDFVETAVAYAANKDMKVCLYDEGMYPSGSAHGGVVECNPDFEAQVLIRLEYSGVLPKLKDFEKLIHIDPINKTASGCKSAAYIQTRSGGKIRGIHFGEDSSEPGAPAAADLMNPEATDCFIRLTHAKYYRRLSQYFGTTITSIFTDEPSLTGRGNMDGKIPWTNGMLEICADDGIMPDMLCELFEMSGAYNQDTYTKFIALCRKRMSENFYRKISEWCISHGISLTGHPSQSDDIGLLEYFQIPGQDLVLRKVAPEEGKGLLGRDSTLAKCSSDAARHSDRRRNSVECFGCCVRDDVSHGWNMPPEDMKWYIDWLAVRGVNLFMPHAFYYSLRDRRAYERPPDVGPAQTWWQEYRYWADYMTRLSGLMTDAILDTTVAILCTDAHLPYIAASHLYRNQIDFCYLENKYISPEKLRVAANKLVVGRYHYNTIIVEDAGIFDKAAINQLKYLSNEGIKVIFTQSDEEDWIKDIRDLSKVRVKSYTPDLRITSIKKDKYNAVFLVNEGDEPLNFELEHDFNTLPIIWDPWKSFFYLPDTNHQNPDNISMHLQYRSSLVLIFTDPDIKLYGTVLKKILRTQFAARENGSGMIDKADNPISAIDISKNWVVSADKKFDKTTIETLADWNTIITDEIYSGKVTYINEITLQAIDSRKTILELGEVHDAVAVYVNGEKIETLFWQPYTADLTNYVIKGVNRITLEVMNNISCKMDQIALPSGLIGPVIIKQYQAEVYQ